MLSEAKYLVQLETLYFVQHDSRRKSFRNLLAHSRRMKTQVPYITLCKVIAAIFKRLT